MANIASSKGDAVVSPATDPNPGRLSNGKKNRKVVGIQKVKNSAKHVCSGSVKAPRTASSYHPLPRQPV